MSETTFTTHLIRYIFGFGAALCLSVGAYFIAVSEAFNNATTMTLLLALAVIQLVIQLVCFLHLGVRDRSRSRTFMLAFTLVMALIIIVGSIWIMRNLDYRMATSSEAMNDYMRLQNKKGF